VASRHCCCWGLSSRTPTPGVCGATMFAGGAVPTRHGLLLLMLLFMYRVLEAVAEEGGGGADENELDDRR